MIPFWKKTGKHSKPQSAQKRRQNAKPAVPRTAQQSMLTSGNATRSFRTRWVVGLTCSTVVCRPVVPMAPAHPASNISFRRKP